MFREGYGMCVVGGWEEEERRRITAEGMWVDYQERIRIKVCVLEAIVAMARAIEGGALYSLDCALSHTSGLRPGWCYLQPSKSDLATPTTGRRLGANDRVQEPPRIPTDPLLHLWPRSAVRLLHNQSDSHQATSCHIPAWCMMC